MSATLPEMVIAYLADRHGWSADRVDNARRMIANCMAEGASESSVCDLILEVDNLVSMSDSELAEVRKWYEESHNSQE